MFKYLKNLFLVVVIFLNATIKIFLSVKVVELVTITFIKFYGKKSLMFHGGNRLVRRELFYNINKLNLIYVFYFLKKERGDKKSK